MGDNEDNARRRRLFVNGGRPARFFLHESINRESQRQKLRVDIEVHETKPECRFFFDGIVYL